MKRNKEKDNKLFNCRQDYELRYVASLYADSSTVYGFLKTKCHEGRVRNLTHTEVYKLINKELGFDIPD